MKKLIYIFIFTGFIYSNDTIYFIYNAKDDFVSVLGDFFHKSISPKTYPCNLCSITYGPFSKKKKWKQFLGSLHHDYEFIYKDKIRNFNKHIENFPVVLFGSKEKNITLLSTEKINSINDLDELIHELKKQLDILK